MTNLGVESDVQTSIVFLLAFSDHFNVVLTGQEPILEFTVLSVIMVHQYPLGIDHMIIQPLSADFRCFTVLIFFRQAT